MRRIVCATGALLGAQSPTRRVGRRPSVVSYRRWRRERPHHDNSLMKPDSAEGAGKLAFNLILETGRAEQEPSESHRERSRLSRYHERDGNSLALAVGILTGADVPVSSSPFVVCDGYGDHAGESLALRKGAHRRRGGASTGRSKSFPVAVSMDSIPHRNRDGQRRCSERLLKMGVQAPERNHGHFLAEIGGEGASEPSRADSLASLSRSGCGCRGPSRSSRRNHASRDARDNPTSPSPPSAPRASRLFRLPGRRTSSGDEGRS